MKKLLFLALLCPISLLIACEQPRHLTISMHELDPQPELLDEIDPKESRLDNILKIACDPLLLSSGCCEFGVRHLCDAQFGCGTLLGLGFYALLMCDKEYGESFREYHSYQIVQRLKTKAKNQISQLFPCFKSNKEKTE